jgi:hypothetical protein
VRDAERLVPVGAVEDTELSSPSIQKPGIDDVLQVVDRMKAAADEVGQSGQRVADTAHAISVAPLHLATTSCPRCAIAIP